MVVPPSPSQSPSPSPSASRSPDAEDYSSAAPDGIITTDTRPTGAYRSSTLTIAPTHTAPTTHTYVVKVETSLDLDADEVARQVQATLDDPRGWVGYGRNNFRLVPAAASPQFTIYIATGRTVNRLCAPLSTGGKWNCRNGDAVVLNADRWIYATPTYTDLGAYRNYLVNHEVGHYLGQGHVPCPRKGGKAPVMMQQSIDLGGCLPNPWPRESA